MGFPDVKELHELARQYNVDIQILASANQTIAFAGKNVIRTRVVLRDRLMIDVIEFFHCKEFGSPPYRKLLLKAIDELLDRTFRVANN